MTKRLTSLFRSGNIPNCYCSATVAATPRRIKTRNTTKMSPSLLQLQFLCSNKIVECTLRPLSKTAAYWGVLLTEVARCYNCGLPIASPETTSSTLRFSCRPLDVTLDATGDMLPKPLAFTEFVVTPCSTRNLSTAPARFSDSF
jgi:hypothetical protein